MTFKKSALENTKEIIDFIQGNLIRNINEYKPLSLVNALNITYYQMTGNLKQLVKPVIQINPKKLETCVIFDIHDDSRGLDVDISLIYDFAKKIASEHGIFVHDNGNLKLPH